MPDEFDDAFKLLTEEEPAGAADATAGLVAPEAPKAPPAAEKPAGGAATPPAVEPEGLPDPAEVAADAQPKAEAEPEVAVEAQPKAEAEPTMAEFLREFRSTMQAPKAADQPSAQAEAPAAVAPYTPREQELVDGYLREWPDVYAAEQLIRRQEYQALVAHIFGQLAPVLQGIGKQTQQLVTQTHLEQLQHAVPDYAEVAPKVVEWVGKQPDYVKGAYEAVVKQGSVSDVVDLIGRYRAATGAPAPAVQQQTPAPAAPSRPAPKPSLVKGLAPVRSARTGVQTDVVANDDFDAAFAAAARDA